jgi:transcriptional regulator with XRE-family HTH domain
VTIDAAYLRKVQDAGWQIVRVRPANVRVRCKVPGCGLYITVAPDRPLPCAAGRVEGVRLDLFDTYDPIRRQLAARREALGLSQKEVEEAAGFTNGHVGKMERTDYERTPTLDTLVTWAATLGLNVSLVEAPLPHRTLQALVSKRHEVERSAQYAQNARLRGAQR